MNTDSEKLLAHHLFAQREEQFVHASFDREVAFYESIGSGDMELVRVFATPLCSDPGCGVLSKDPLRNIKYHFVVSASIVARFCVRSGMTPEEAYQLSDFYINRADECRSIEEVRKVHWQMIETYTRHMRSVRTSAVFSKPVVCAMDYISDNLHSRIRLEDTAAHLHISSAYLSRLFKAETGMNFSDYVNRKKIEAAAGLLRYSEFSTLEISSLFAFSSQSYFIKIFRQYKGMTPKAYQKTYRHPDTSPIPEQNTSH
ncbi:MAG: AraC family transcriptional regulator [Oscillospiraceae bacterium]|nr:AraC family transcriptional regulator [Oscillospiraceae bacterium]